MSDPAQRGRDVTARDAMVARALGAFLCVMALPVLAGTFFATLPVDRWINVVAGLILLAIGAGFLARARRP